ncbi:hypothetical protein [Pantoea alfalfae]|nr:hypothetical protein [Pantoea alfalfae]
MKKALLPFLLLSAVSAAQAASPIISDNDIREKADTISQRFRN